jgi:hypothetical protein
MSGLRKMTFSGLPLNSSDTVDSAQAENFREILSNGIAADQFRYLGDKSDD